MRRLLGVGLCLSFIAFTSCKKSAGTKAGYFDSLVFNQINLLNLSKATLTKNARMGASSDEITFTPTRKVWETELAVFRQLDAFQKPAYRSMYSIEDSVKDPGSNLSIRTYSTTANIPVRELKFYYHRKLGNLKRIEGLYAEENSLYVGSRKLSLEFDDVKGKVTLTAFKIDGVQHMMLSDTFNFSIIGTIRY